MRSKYPTISACKPSPLARAVYSLARSGKEAAMNIGRIVREVEALPDSDEELHPMPEPTPDPVSEPAQQPV